MSRRLLCGLGMLAALAMLPHRAVAQNTITLEGVVTAADDGSPLAGAQLAITNLLSGEKRLATTRPTGEFRVLGLFSGRYEVAVRILGYRPAADTIQLVLGQRARLTIALEKGAADIAGVTISGTKFKEVEVQRLSVSAPILKEEIENLP
ncbi:MAG: carboxypeptidase-like regulatory domain-containing protein, partial [Gemmatimonadaceae bacterium]|nr:carboxypeptidase-like regulatory domain-containing protein [Gemmatimonadaceae bacterium]